MPPLDVKRIPLKKIFVPLLSATLFFTACRKERFEAINIAKECIQQTVSPLNQSYSCTDLVAIDCQEKHCGLMPVSAKSYWVYQDSVFTDGQFSHLEYDTLHFKAYRSLPDNLVWWKTNKDVGLPEFLYTNDSVIFGINNRFFAQDCIKDSKKEYALFAGDSARYLTSFEDNAAMGRSVKLKEEMKCPAGQFNDCILFEKNAPFFRKDVMIFKPGVGVLKYKTEKAPMGYPQMQLEKISTLISYYIE